MSVSLTIIKKEHKKVSLIEFIETYIKSLETMYTPSEMQSFVYGETREGVLGMVFESSTLEEETTENQLIKRHVVAGRVFTILKMLHQNTHESRAELVNKFRALVADTEVPFVILEHTALISDDMNTSPPGLTKGGSVYFDMGVITKYFIKRFNPNADQPGAELRGFEFASKMQGKTHSEIIDAYFSKFIDVQNYGGLTDIQQTGLPHFTTVLCENNGKPTIWFLQNLKRFCTAAYFFEPDYFFCNSECIARTFREQYYGGVDTQIKKNLQKIQVPLE